MNILAEQPLVALAREIVHRSDDLTISDMIELVQIPAPPFGETERGRWIHDRFRRLGLVNVTIDEVGNVLARMPPSLTPCPLAPPILLAAHIDTVFPEHTPLVVRRDGDRLIAPGIADNARGVAAILAIARSLLQAGVPTRHPLIFVATVGEEGIGDLRGVKHLFRAEGECLGTAGFVALDGTGSSRIVHRALGSCRLRVTITGPGGHSWADWGRVNPIEVLGVGIGRIAALTPPDDPRTVISIGRIGGGTSVNSIPEAAWMEMDIRSEHAGVLADYQARVLHILDDATAYTNAARQAGSPAAELTIERIGKRPTGETPADAPIVRAAAAATHFIGRIPELVTSSTDANVPIAAGVPAIAIGAGGESGGTHTVEEWFSNAGGPQGIERALLTVLAVAHPDGGPDRTAGPAVTGR
jgi:tripeptide aminopeptidase